MRCRPNTAELYRTAVEKHLIPRLGKQPALAVDHARVTELHHALRDRPVMANTVVETLSRIYNAAEDDGLIPEASNPCGLVVKNRERKRERYLTPEEFERLGLALDEVLTCRRVSPYSVAAIRLLMLTGCRKREILDLRWEHVDLEAAELRLSDSKTGPRTVWLSGPARKVLDGIERTGRWVFPAPRTGGPSGRSWLDRFWSAIRAEAELCDVRLHDLRHTHASIALRQGETVLAIGRLLGHRNAETTLKYTHAADAMVLDAAETVGAILER